MNKQEPTGEVNDKGKGNVRKVSTAGMSWVDFARPYMKKQKAGGMKKAGEDWRKMKAKKEKKSKRKVSKITKEKVIKRGKAKQQKRKEKVPKQETGGY